jgi:hypothetical protein
VFLTRFYSNIATAITLASRVNAIEEEWEGVQLEWVDTREAFTLLLKRLSTRAARATKDDPVGPEPEQTPVSGQDGRERLLQLARARGFRV